MDPQEIDRIEQLLPQHEELRRLWHRHRELESELAALRAHRFLTPEEQQREKEIQKAKLAGKDQILAILRGVGR